MKKILFIFKDGTENGGPTISHKRIINSSLKEKFLFYEIKLPKGKFTLGYFLHIFSVVKEIKKIRPDVIHIIGLELIGFYSSLAAFFYKKAKIIMGIHGSSEEAIVLQKKFFKITLLKLFQWITLLLVDKYYTVSQYTSKFKILRNFKNKDAGVIYNIIEIPTFSNSNFNFLYKPDIFYVVSLGRIEIEKGFDVLTEIIKKTTNPAIFYIIIGEGSYLSTMKEELLEKNNVYFTGFIQNPSFFLSNSNVFLTASKHETFGMAIAEAGLLGLPLLSYKVGGIPEIIEDGFNGFLLDENNSDAFLKKINWFYQNFEICKRMGKNSINLLNNKFSKEQTLYNIQKLYEESL